MRFLPLDYRKIRQKLSFSIFIEFLQWQKLSFWENPIEFWENSIEVFFRIEFSEFGLEFKICLATQITSILIQNVRVPHLIFISIRCYEKFDFGFIKK